MSKKRKNAFVNTWFDVSELPEPEPDVLRIGITGSHLYEDKVKIKKFLFNLKEKVAEKGKRIVVCSCGKKFGADVYIKKYTLDFGLDYAEFNPAHTVHNLYSIMLPAYYGKIYHPAYNGLRNQLLIKYVHHLFVFTKNISDSDDIENLLKCAENESKIAHLVS